MLDTSDTFLKTVLNTVIDGIIVIDQAGIIHIANAYAEKIFGYSAEEMIGKNVSILMPQPDSHRHDSYIRNYLQSGHAHIIGVGREVTGLRKNGERFPMELAVSESQISGERFFVGVARDITARKQAERELDEKNREIQASASFDRTHGHVMELFSSHNDQHAILQQALASLAESQSILASAVYLYDEWSGSLRCAASFGAPPGLQRECYPGEGMIGQAAQDRLTHILTAGPDMPLTIETGLFTVTPQAVAATPILYQGKVMGVLVVATTEPLKPRKQAFLERLAGQMGVGLNNIKQFHDLKALSDQLKQRGREIARKNAQLEDANRLKSEFLANMSHELRTPLNAIIGFSEVLKDGLLGDMPEEQVDYIQDIFDSANHLLSLINDILDLSKIEAGKMELDVSELDLHEVFSNSLSIVKERAHANRIHLELDVPEELDAMQADGRKVKQILYNLLSNAVKFTPSGGKVTLRARRDGDWLEIAVADTGIGIAADKISRLFRHFEQLDGSLSRKHEGTGLGLVMVKRLAELHGGQVGVESEPNKGSTFTVRLPMHAAQTKVAEPAVLAPAAPAPVAAAPAAPQARTGSPRILVVEPNADSAQMIRQQLDSEGYQVEWARGSSEAQQKIAQARPNLIVLDILFSESDEWSLFKRLRDEQDELADIPVVLVSLDEQGKGFNLGELRLLEKPLHREALLSMLQRLLPDERRTQAHILVVDDDPNAVEFVSTQLRGEGYQVRSANNGTSAIELATQELPDLLILDLMMPEVNGFEVVSALRANPATENLPIVILTAKILDDDDRLLLAGHVSQVVEKRTFDTRSFMDQVHSALLDASIQGAARPAAGKPRVLVIEDNEEQSSLLRLYLEDAGYQVRLAYNGREGLEALAEDKPDLITLDLLMPEMDGFAFLEEKARRPEFANVPVIVISAIADRDTGIPLVADAILSKPLRRQELMQALGDIIRLDDPNRRPKVLLVDDDPKAIRIISSYLPSDSMEVLAAFGGADGLEAARLELPDLILLDLMMPDFSGFDVLRELKRDDSTRRIPVIILTAKILTTEERTTLQEQVELVAEKGKAGKEQIVAEVNAILGRYRKA